jgi:hypothetical protein
MAPTALAYDLADGTEGSGLTDSRSHHHHEAAFENNTNCVPLVQRRCGRTSWRWHMQPE